MLELMKELLDMAPEGTSKDTILNFYLSKSQTAIKKYSNIDEIPEEYNNSIVELAVYFYKNKDKAGLTSITQGARAQSMIDGIPESIKTCLPTPQIKVVG